MYSTRVRPSVLVLRFGQVHEDGCEELSNTQDWIPLREFSEEALKDVDLDHCPECLDEPVPEAVDAETAAPAASLN